MEIDINQKSISIGDKYQIFLDGVKSYNATAEYFGRFSVINLFDTTGKQLLTINEMDYWFIPEYTITIWDNDEETHFQCDALSFWTIHYQCQKDSNKYEIYGHRGRKYSVFKNGEQVAFWQKDAVSWFEGDNYKIVANGNSEKEFLIAFCLIIDNQFSKYNNGNTITIDLGNIGPQARKFDKEWQPKI